MSNTGQNAAADDNWIAIELRGDKWTYQQGEYENLWNSKPVAPSQGSTGNHCASEQRGEVWDRDLVEVGNHLKFDRSTHR